VGPEGGAISDGDGLKKEVKFTVPDGEEIKNWRGGRRLLVKVVVSGPRGFGVGDEPPEGGPIDLVHIAESAQKDRTRPSG